MMTENNNHPLLRLIIILTLSALGLRLLTLGIYPLMDTTEARYGEIARIMVETGNWITPQFDYDIPFWGKPPLYTWITAISFKLFGISEFSARLPHFLTGLLVLGLIWQTAAKQLNRLAAALSVMILSTTVVFLISIGAVMTDTVLLLAVTLTLVSFWRAWNHSEGSNNLWSYLFFFGLGIGLLAKGPIIWILTGLPVFLWCLPEKRLVTIWRKLPWIKGIALMLLISLPWYFLAESKTPGFLNYFIVGEHFKRFLVSGWEGDLYGTAHSHPKGMIWIMWLYAAFPWNLALPLLLWQRFKNKKVANTANHSNSSSNASKSKEWRLFLWCWMLSPMLFFTMAGNVIWPYVLPGVPALALLVADYLCEHFQSNRGAPIRSQRRWLIPSLATPVIVLLITGAASLGLSKDSAKEVAEAWLEQPDSHQSTLLFWNKRPFSGQFYSEGRGVRVTTLDQLADIQDKGLDTYLIVRHKDMEQLPEEITASIEEISKGRKSTLFILVSDQAES